MKVVLVYGKVVWNNTGEKADQVSIARPQLPLCQRGTHPQIEQTQRG
jgi:hypothetical protein